MKLILGVDGEVVNWIRSWHSKGKLLKSATVNLNGDFVAVGF